MPLGRVFSDDCKPLTSTERDDVIEAAVNSRPDAAVSTLFILFSGIKATAVPHVTSEFVTAQTNLVKIRLPPGERNCTIIGNGSPRIMGQTDDEIENTPTDGSCFLCDDGTFEFDAPRTVPIRDPQAVEVVSEWFSLYDYLPAYRHMLNLLKYVGEKAGVDRLKGSVLRHTYGVILASKGFSRREIERIMGMNPWDMNSDVVLSYGRLCEGRNPFRCGASTNRGGTCDKVVKQGKCHLHTETE